MYSKSSVKNLDNFNGAVYVVSTVNNSRYMLNIRSKCTVITGDSGAGKTAFISSLETAFQTNSDMEISGVETDGLQLIQGGSRLLRACLQEPQIETNYFSDDSRIESSVSFADLLIGLPNISRSGDVIVRTDFHIMVLNNSVDTIRRIRNQSWFQLLSEVVTEETLVCCDEDFLPMYTRGFQEAVKELSCRFLFITRKRLYDIPHTQEDVYDFMDDQSSGYTVLQKHKTISTWNCCEDAAKFEFYDKFYDKGYEDKILY